jgi:hypothetical protein
MPEFLKEPTNIREKTYIVQEGDNLSIISQNFLAMPVIAPLFLKPIGNNYLSLIRCALANG